MVNAIIKITGKNVMDDLIFSDTHNSMDDHSDTFSNIKSNQFEGVKFNMN